MLGVIKPRNIHEIQNSTAKHVKVKAGRELSLRPEPVSIIITMETALKYFASAAALAGAGYVAMGFGLIDVDPDAQAVAHAVLFKYVDIPVKPFFVFLGGSKVLGVLGLWGYGPFSGSGALTYASLLLPAACATVGHYLVDDPPMKTAAAGLYVVALLYYKSCRENVKGKIS